MLTGEKLPVPGQKQSLRPGLQDYSIKIGLINTGFTYICTRKGICRLFKSLCSDSQARKIQKNPGTVRLEMHE
jgi:hypothetical protein